MKTALLVAYSGWVSLDKDPQEIWWFLKMGGPQYGSPKYILILIKLLWGPKKAPLILGNPPILSPERAPKKEFEFL